ncbi:hypothetical protein [uncultured Dubosiella sp.]|uniref:hypothetical protein n=1 Tax=uncultured Dubosiella sp. TaxID=1937011 RepID=UPI0027303C6B|nr:hypothetical protein [uncultured Dubosiella sp.]
MPFQIKQQSALVDQGIPKERIAGAYYRLHRRGQSVKYIAKCAYKGHRWVRYVRVSGGYGCVAVSGSEVHGKDPWATFK